MFEIIPRFSSLNTALPSLKERMKALKTAQSEINLIVAERKVCAALTHDISPVSLRTYKLDKETLVYSKMK